MRIGYLTYGLDRAPTGIGRYVVALLTALAELPGAPEIVLLTTERADPYGLWRRFERYPLPGCRHLPALLTLGHAAVSAACRRLRLDLLHDPNGIAPFLGPAAGARRVVTLYDAFAYVLPATHNRLDTWRYRWQLPRAARRADAVITISQCSRRDLARYLALDPRRIHLAPAAVEPAFAPSGAVRPVLDRFGIRQPYLLYVGGINARKNIARLYEAYARVRARQPEVRLVIAGKRQWQTAEIDATFARLALHDHVTFTGYVADGDLPALYSGAAAFVFPSLYEGFGLPPLEAMACGAPVVTSSAGALPEVAGDAALLVEPTDVDALTSAIERVLSDQALRADLRARGLARARQFTWEQAARATLGVYTSLLQAAPATTAAVYQAGSEHPHVG